MTYSVRQDGESWLVVGPERTMLKRVRLDLDTELTYFTRVVRRFAFCYQAARFAMRLNRRLSRGEAVGRLRRKPDKSDA
jgi:hypothetical protein